MSIARVNIGDLYRNMGVREGISGAAGFVAFSLVYIFRKAAWQEAYKTTNVGPASLGNPAFDAGVGLGMESVTVALIVYGTIFFIINRLFPKNTTETRQHQS